MIGRLEEEEEGSSGTTAGQGRDQGSGKGGRDDVGGEGLVVRSPSSSEKELHEGSGSFLGGVFPLHNSVDLRATSRDLPSSGVGVGGHGHAYDRDGFAWRGLEAGEEFGRRWRREVVQGLSVIGGGVVEGGDGGHIDGARCAG